MSCTVDELTVEYDQDVLEAEYSLVLKLLLEQSEYGAYLSNK